MIRPPDSFYKTWASFQNIIPSSSPFKAPCPLMLPPENDEEPPSDNDDDKIVYEAKK